MFQEYVEASQESGRAPRFDMGDLLSPLDGHMSIVVSNSTLVGLEIHLSFSPNIMP